MRISILKVNGNSMHPTFESGAFVFVCHSKLLFKQTSLCGKLPIVGRYLASTIVLKVGDIVAVSHPKYGQIIKRVAKMDYGSKRQDPLSQNQLLRSFLSQKQSGSQPLIRLRLRGDNATQSLSESAMGWVDIEHVIGKVIYTVSR